MKRGEGSLYNLLVLDVGCGDNPRGDVNVDFVVGANPHTGDQMEEIRFIDPKKIRNFIRASSELLPFRDRCFDKVVSYEVIEHVDAPFQMLKEMIRVTRTDVLLTCPHRLSPYAKMPYHKNYFDRRWFKQAAEKLGVTSQIKLAKRLWLPHVWPFRRVVFRSPPLSQIPVLRPAGLTVTIKK